MAPRKMNYGGYGSRQDALIWSRWEEKFLYFPKKIEGKWYWMRKVFYRTRIYSLKASKNRQWAVDIFDLIQKNNE